MQYQNWYLNIEYVNWIKVTGQNAVAGFSENFTEPLGLIKQESINHDSNYILFKKDPVSLFVS
jgi:hypothetical protein